jgi:hypothetical protein
MDNRRYARPSTRDNRRSDEEIIDVEPPGHEVEVVELSSPTPRKPPSPGTIWTAIALVGVIGFAAGFAWPRGGSGSPGQSGVPVAAESQPAASESPPSGEAPSRAPSDRPSPRPTRTPGPAEWLAYDLDVPNDSEILDLVSFDGQFVMPVRTYTPDGQLTFRLFESMSGRSWSAASVPPAIQDLQAPTLIDGRLWFLASVVGIAEPTFELISTDGRGEWQSLGPTKGLGMEDGGILALARVGDRWIVSTYRYDCCDGGAARQDIRTSSDGVTWSIAEVPAAESDAFSRSFTIDGSLGLIGMSTEDPNPMSFLITTRDGRKWSRVGLPEEAGQLFEVRCSVDICVALGSRQDVGVSLPTMATSTNGTDWTVATGDRLPELSSLTVTPFGFLGLDNRSTTAWLSSDGLAWRDVVVIPEDTDGHYAFRVAANGEYVAAIGARESSTSYVSWAGTLDTLIP